MNKNNELDSIFLQALKVYEESNGKITASMIKLEKDKLYNKIAMLAEAEIERKLYPKDKEYLIEFMDEYITGNAPVKTVYLTCHPMTILPDAMKVMFMRKTDTLINLFILDADGTPQLYCNFGQNSAYGKKLAKKHNIDFTKLVK